MDDPTKPEDKRELAEYIKSINLGNPEKLGERSEEIMNNVRRVMKPYLDRPDDDVTKRYYEPTIRGLEEAFEKKDFEKTFPLVLDSLRISIMYE